MQSSDPPIAVIVAISVLSFVLTMGVVVYFMRDLFGPLWSMLRSKVVAEVEVESQDPRRFVLRHVTRNSCPHRACLKLKMSGEDSFVGLCCDYQVIVGGQVVTKECVGYGQRPPHPFDRHITSTFFSVESRRPRAYSRKGTIILSDLEPCAPQTDIVVEGTIKLNPATRAGPMSVSLRA